MHRVVTTMLRPDTTLRRGTSPIGIGTRCRHRALTSAILATGADFVFAALTYAGTDCGKGPAGGGKEGGQVGRTPQGRPNAYRPDVVAQILQRMTAGETLMLQGSGCSTTSWRNLWVACRLDIARHWAAMHPYPGAGLNEG